MNHNIKSQINIWHKNYYCHLPPRKQSLILFLGMKESSCRIARTYNFSGLPKMKSDLVIKLKFSEHLPYLIST